MERPVDGLLPLALLHLADGEVFLVADVGHHMVVTEPYINAIVRTSYNKM